MKSFKWPNETEHSDSILNFLDKKVSPNLKLEAEKCKVLDIWQEFLDRIPLKDKLPSFPIWSMEFGATYPFEENIPIRSSSIALSRVKGAFGKPLMGLKREDKLNNIPNYANKENKDKKGNSIPFPTWKKHYIRSNREFYKKYKKEIDPILPKLIELGIPSWQKFEWNVQGGERNISKYILQFRGSGIRVKKTDFFPSLVTVSTQVPIIGWERRYISPLEGARIQSLENIELPENKGACFGALGNAVNANIVEKIAANLIIQSDFKNNEDSITVVKKIAV